MGRKPVHSFEEVLWLTGSLDYRYSCAVVGELREFMRTWSPDVVYSEFNLAAVIAARAEGISCVGSGSQPTTVAYASNPRKSAGIRRLLRESRAGTGGGGAGDLLRFSWRYAESGCSQHRS